MVLSNAVRIEAPPVVPARGGLLAAATVHPEWDSHMGFGIEYQSWLCGGGGTLAAACGIVAPGMAYDPSKTFDGSGYGAGYPFTIFAGVKCDLLSGPYGDRARARLTGIEDYLVSKGFYEQAFYGDLPFEAVQTANAPPDSATLNEVADIIGELEEYAALNYAGTPVLHMNRRTTSLAIAVGVVKPDVLSGVLATVQGTPVANAAGYPDEIVFITGQVNVWRGPVNTFEVPALADNQSYALAERTYIASTECLLAYAGTVVPAPAPDTYVTP